ncbi:hypothetical protein MKX01_014339, partial [Papaver californicum]
QTFICSTFFFCRRVSDLKGPNLPFPYFKDMNSLRQLELRNCLIDGSIPSNIGEMLSGLMKLDLSFNRLTGDIQNLKEIPFLSNMIVPFSSIGGSEMGIGDEKYEADLSPMGPSSFFSYNDRWACSTTGDYDGASTPKANYLTQASRNMTVKDLYMTARISPLSLKYYGICLRPGNYKVKLHFAEIMFPIDKTAGGIGTHIFDVSIQVKEAKGVGKSIIKEFDVDVTSSTLEIHLYWAGKGTSFIPSDITYGPLISAIAVTPNFEPDASHISVGVIAGIVAAAFVLIVQMFVAHFPFLAELRELLQTSYFTSREIKAATRNFDRANKIGEGGFGPVYKGLRPDGSLIAVKQLSAMSKQGNREFVNEIGIISALQHPNLVKLFGCCVEGNQLLVIYEYMENNSFARALYVIRDVTVLGRADQRLNLDWPTRFRICMDIAKGLAFLHEESRLKIVHRDIKATNVLLDKDFTARISDFEQGNLLDLIDPILKSNYSKKEVLRMLNIALLCTNRSPSLRPMIPRTDDTRSSASEEISHDSQKHTSTSSQGMSNSGGSKLIPHFQLMTERKKMMKLEKAEVILRY